MSTQQQEWAAFLALIPYFSACPGPLKIRTRLQKCLQQCQETTLTRDILLLRAGLSFFAHDGEVDLALMQLIREGVIRPVVEHPFTFMRGDLHPQEVPPCAPPSSQTLHPTNDR